MENMTYDEAVLYEILRLEAAVEEHQKEHSKLNELLNYYRELHRQRFVCK